MDILLSKSAGQPFYEQILRQLKMLILTGALAQGDPLPSMRQLAKDLQVSVITTRRAYDELEQAGFITSVAGRGTFVATPDTASVLEEHHLLVERHLRSAVEAARTAGIPLASLAAQLSKLYTEDK